MTPPMTADLIEARELQQMQARFAYLATDGTAPRVITRHDAAFVAKALSRLSLVCGDAKRDDGEGAFQDRVGDWMLLCFNQAIADDRLERSDRFIEEALELVQAGGYSADRAHALVDYVFGRPVGEMHQEIGGVMVTLATLCTAFGHSMVDEGERELKRILHPDIVEKIRRKQASKPVGSALPVPPPHPATGEVKG